MPQGATTGALVAVSTGGCVGGSVAVGGSEVGGGCGVFVSGGTGVSVSGGGRGVLVGGMGVNVWDGICVGEGGTWVAVRVAGWIPGPRVRVGGNGVRVGMVSEVEVELLAAGTIDDVSVGVAVGVNTYCEITSTVSAAMVFMFEKAESTMF